MKCNPHPETPTLEEEMIYAARRAAAALRLRFGGAVDAPVTDQMIIAATWFLTYADRQSIFDEEFVRALHLRWARGLGNYPMLERDAP